MEIDPKYRIWLLLPGVLLVGLIAYFFFDILIYILFGAAVSFLGRPVVKFLRAVRIYRWHIPDWLAALLALLLIYSVLFAVFWLAGPLVFDQAQTLSSGLDLDKIQREANVYWEQILPYITRFSPAENYSLEATLDAFFARLDLATFFADTGELLGGVFVALFSVTFISFFFLKESSLFSEMLLSLAPSGQKDRAARVLGKVKALLTRYFVGVLIEVFLVGLLITLGLRMIGVENAIFIGFLVGIFNIVPYAGPLAGYLVTLALVTLAAFAEPVSPPLLPIWVKATAVFGIVQLIDNLVFQPLIYASSVKAHPLEIFLVLLAAAKIAGVPGMILAIPVYTLVRVVASEFLSEYPLVQALTRRIS